MTQYVQPVHLSTAAKVMLVSAQTILIALLIWIGSSVVDMGKDMARVLQQTSVLPTITATQRDHGDRITRLEDRLDANSAKDVEQDQRLKSLEQHERTKEQLGKWSH